MSKNLTIRVNPNAPVTLSGFGQIVHAFLVWWSHELVALLPASWHRKLIRARATPRVAITTDSWQIQCGIDPILEFANTMARWDVRDELLRKAPQVFEKSAKITLPREEALFRRIMMPASGLVRVRQVVRLQLDRLSPFRGDDVQFDCYPVEREQVVLGSTDDTKEVLVEVIIIPKRRLIAIEQELRIAGIVPAVFTIGGISARFAPNGLPWTKQMQHRAVALAIGLVLAIAAVALGPPMHDNEIGGLRAETEVLAPQVERALTDRDTIQHYQLPTQALSPDRAAVLDLMLDLTKRLPDSAHLTKLAISADHVSMEGAAPASVPIESLLTHSSWLTRLVVSKRSNGRFFATAELRRSSVKGK